MKVFYVSLLKPLYIWSVFSFDFLESLTTATGLTDWLKWRGQPSVIKFFEVFKPFDQLINRLFEHKNVFERKSSDNQDYKGVYLDRFPSLIVSYCAYSKAKDMVVEKVTVTHTSVKSCWSTLGTAVCTAYIWLCVPKNEICPSLSTIASPSLNLLAKFTSPIKCSDRRPKARSIVVKSLSVQCKWRHSLSAVMLRWRPAKRTDQRILYIYIQNISINKCTQP